MYLFKEITELVKCFDGKLQVCSVSVVCRRMSMEPCEQGHVISYPPHRNQQKFSQTEKK